eukprot:751533-Hanusia_phi.AAC.6
MKSSFEQILYSSVLSMSLGQLLMPLKQAADAGPELFSTLQEIHNAGMLHKDISAGNIMIRIRRGHLEYFLIDFGLASFYNSKDEAEDENGEMFDYDGTPEFVSPRLMKGFKPSRVDDIYSLLMSLIKLIKEKLPWSGLTETEMLQMKSDFSAKSLCANLQPNYRVLLEELLKSDTTKDILYDRLFLLLEDISSCADVTEAVDFLLPKDQGAGKRKNGFVENKNMQIKRIHV